MYVSHIGKRFLEYYNKKNGTSYSAKEYFIQVHWPMFYDDENYLHSPGNTPFFQLIAQHKTGDSLERKNALTNFNSKIDEYIQNHSGLPDMSFAISYPAAGEGGTTSGQVTSMEIGVSEEDIYASWIGTGLTIGIAGGINILVDNEQIYQYIIEGYNVYREYIKENPGIKNKIETWNGIWLNHRVSNNFNVSDYSFEFHPLKIKKDKVEMVRISWIEAYFILSKILNSDIAQTYVFALGQMNKTIGFIQFFLKDVRRLSMLYKEIYADVELLSKKELSAIYETELGFYTACQSGVLGLRQLEPKNFKKFMLPNAKGEYSKPKQDDKSLTNYYIYNLWVIAMLNNKDLISLAKEAAGIFKKFTSSKRRVGTSKDSVITAILESKNKKQFIDNINNALGSKDFRNEILNGSENIEPLAPIFEKLVNAAMLDIAIDNLPLFISLLKFEYLINNNNEGVKS